MDHTMRRAVRAVLTFPDDDLAPIETLIDSTLLPKLPSHYVRDAVLWQIADDGRHIVRCHQCRGYFGIPLDPTQAGSLLADVPTICPDCIPFYAPSEPRRREVVIPHDLRLAILNRDGYCCLECGSVEDLTLDHIHPQSKGGAHTYDNLRVLCRSCNSRKGARVA